MLLKNGFPVSLGFLWHLSYTMAPKALFTKCTCCGVKMTQINKHNLCLFYFSEGHNVPTCKAASASPPKLRWDRVLKLKSALWGESPQSLRLFVQVTPEKLSVAAPQNRCNWLCLLDPCCNRFGLGLTPLWFIMPPLNHQLRD